MDEILIRQAKKSVQLKTIGLFDGLHSAKMLFAVLSLTRVKDVRQRETEFVEEIV